MKKYIFLALMLLGTITCVAQERFIVYGDSTVVVGLDSIFVKNPSTITIDSVTVKNPVDSVAIRDSVTIADFYDLMIKQAELSSKLSSILTKNSDILTQLQAGISTTQADTPYVFLQDTLVFDQGAGEYLNVHNTDTVYVQYPDTPLVRIDTLYMLQPSGSYLNTHINDTSYVRLFETPGDPIDVTMSGAIIVSDTTKYNTYVTIDDTIAYIGDTGNENELEDYRLNSVILIGGITASDSLYLQFSLDGSNWYTYHNNAGNMVYHSFAANGEWHDLTEQYLKIRATYFRFKVMDNQSDDIICKVVLEKFK